MSEEKSLKKIYVVYCEDDDDAGESIMCACENEEEALSAMQYLKWTRPSYYSYSYKEVPIQTYDTSSLKISYDNYFNCKLRPTEDKDTYIMGSHYLNTTDRMETPQEIRINIHKSIHHPIYVEETEVTGSIVSDVNISKMSILEQRQHIRDAINSKGIIKVIIPEPSDLEALGYKVIIEPRKI